MGKSLCVSEPWGWRAEQLQVATGKSKQVRVGECEVRRGWMKASESGKGQSNWRGRGMQVGKRRKAQGAKEVRVLLVSPPALTGPDCACSTWCPQLTVN